MKKISFRQGSAWYRRWAEARCLLRRQPPSGEAARRFRAPAAREMRLRPTPAARACSAKGAEVYRKW